MGDKNRFSKPVAFNNKNEKDQAILKHVSRRNFSGYVKKLILEDMKAKAQIGIVEPLGESNEQTHAEVVETPLAGHTEA
jgi:hypothetical protein